MITPIIRIIWAILVCLFITIILIIVSVVYFLFYLKGLKYFLGWKEYEVNSSATGLLVWFEDGDWKSPIHWAFKIKN